MAKSPVSGMMKNGMSLHNLVYITLFLAVVALILGGLGTKAYFDVALNDSEDQEVRNLRVNGVFQEYRNNVSSYTPSADGTLAAPSKVLTGDQSGTTYVVNTGTNTAVFQLPAPQKGANFRFIQAITSDAEATKDLAIYTGNAAVFIMGAGVAGGIVYDIPTTATVVQFNSSAGATGAGDRIEVISDGTHWYIVDASTLTAAAIVGGTALA
jgi:hypothetical protein